MLKHPRILYFLNGPVTKPADAAAAMKLGSNVSFRNALLIDPTECLEPCDGVAGFVPDNYAAAYPKGAKVMADFVASLGDVPKPAEGGEEPAAPAVKEVVEAPAFKPATAPNLPAFVAPTNILK